MRMTKLLLPTLREVPAEAEIASHQLMLRAGLIRKLSAGVYSYLPVGLKVLKNIENINNKQKNTIKSYLVVFYISSCSSCVAL